MDPTAGNLAQVERISGLAAEAQLVDAMHRHYVSLYGAGPSEISFDLDDRGRLLCTMRELLTPEERSKVAGGVGERLRDQRLFVRHADRALIETIEAITGADVCAVATSVDPAADLATQAFELRSSYRDMRSV